MADLVLIPCPGIGHLVSILEVAKLLVQRDSRISITVLIINQARSDHFEVIPPSSLISFSSPRIKFVDLPHLPCDASSSPILLLHSLLVRQKPHVKEAVDQLVRANSARLAGVVVDMFCTPMLDVADELRVPGYIYHPSGAQFLSLSFYLQRLQDEEGKDPSEFVDSADGGELVVPGIVNPVPTKVLPKVLLENREVAANYLDHVRKHRRSRGILVNTFSELESHTVDSLVDSDLPPVYPVGPILKISVGPNDANQNFDVIKWLDEQPPSSVVFLCFGSRGSFHEQQVKEIACALEQSGYRFLWSLRQSGPTGTFTIPSDYANLADVLPEGFLDRTAKIGRVIGWAPQVDILAHSAIGGFLTHCGWNSILESVWFGVPMATWSLYAEQQMNAFSLIKEFGLAVEVRMDYRKDFMTEEQVTVSAEEIERGIRGVMEIECEMRRKVKEMSEKSRRAVEEGGSSFKSLGCFIEDIFKNMS